MEAQRVTAFCDICQQVNACGHVELQKDARAYTSFKCIQIDYVEMPRDGHYKYLLVVADQLTGWPEACAVPCAIAAATVKILLLEIIHRFESPRVIKSDQGRHFTAEIVKNLVEAIGSHWRYHTPWHPESSRQVERLNRTIKEQITKIHCETGIKWTKALLIALVRIQATPRGQLGLSLFELMFGRPYPSFRPIPIGLGIIVGHEQLKEYVKQIQCTLSHLQEPAILQQSLLADVPFHKIQQAT